MEILLIEDSATFASRLQAAVTESVEWRVVQTRDAALEELVAGPPADVVVCDLKIPASQSEPTADTSHGLAVFDQVRVLWPGVPIIILSSYADLEMIGDRLTSAPIVDFLGRADLALARHVKKDRVDELAKQLNQYQQDLIALQAKIELVWEGRSEDLEKRDERLIRVYADKRDAEVVGVSRLRAGKSGAVTVALDLRESYGSGSQAVVKLNDTSEVLDEYERYKAHVMDRVQIGHYTPHSELIVVGAGGRGALFYRLADGYTRDLFQVVRESPEEAARVVSSLECASAAWADSATVTRTTVGHVRQMLVRDEIFEGLRDDAPWGTQALEDCPLEVMFARQHGDLHGENVLVNSAAQPMLIDFGRAGKATAALDPVSLEMSAVLHPAAQLDLGSWMSPIRAEVWMDEEQYLDGCPVRPFLEACRRWMRAVSRGDREIAATTYAFALRQMRYDDVDLQIASAMSFGAARHLGRQYGL